MRIDQLLASQYSRKEMKQALAKGQILVDGQAARKLSQNVDTDLQVVTIQGQPAPASNHHYWLLHKPRGVVTANRDAQHATVFDSLASYDRTPDLYALGRLDRDTSGLLLLTDNGPLGYQLLHPDAHVRKTYQVVVNGPLHADLPVLFATGSIFEDGYQCRPAQLTILASSAKQSRALIELSEGKFHQVKKMFLAVGVKVISLSRTQFGPFQLDQSLPYGAYRGLSSQEKQILVHILEESR
ncbi:pseudouridine synthase [Streptococcus danieliae]|uniref:Pseudouridine synthase n=1 Tax=Streptococcus danieliae TaxID=747656 RepID=A0A7Z0S4R6_9STRE|nr:pseudouridine synthase [Streptococcus danieliae]MBF0699126.1 rRNA pseudouridine synthase [Streptococcus danieliae]NYS96302.1 rRNA pseudouridine synthase [Streptococcus danieliae]